MEVSVIFPVIALIIGWLLNELSRYFGLRQERHGAIGQTLSQLLIVRMHMNNVNLLTDFMTTELKIPVTSMPEFKRLYDELIPYSGKEVEQNMRDSIGVIASYDPLLASVLSINMGVSDMFTKLSYKIEGNEEDNAIIINFLSTLENKLMPLLNEAILSLAKKHGLLTSFRVKRLMNEEQHIPEEMKNRLIELKRKLNELPKNS